MYFDRPNDPLPVGPIIGHIVAPMPRRKNKWAKESNDHQTERLLLRVFTKLFDPPFPCSSSYTQHNVRYVLL